ncbi:MAG: hypothetical protein LIR50_12845 [Bacillota bacterium]|nr:hypothetical protein [Bacillota bacterium]
MNKDIEILKHISHEVNETIVLCKSNIYDKTTDQLFKISGELSILIKLKEEE